MSLSQQQLDEVVREVLRRLRERETTHETASEPNTKHNPRVLTLADRLVTLAALHGKLSGIEVIVAPQGAVITPAVKDELNKRKIKLDRTAGKTQTNKLCRHLLLATTGNYDPTGLLKRLTAGGTRLEQLSATDWKEAVRKMTSELTTPMARGVILTDHAAAAACLANRDVAIRAAVACDARTARDAIDSLDANLLVVDPAAHSLFTLENLIREYARSDHREMPL